MAAQTDEARLVGNDFLDLIAHELRQPLTAAMGSLATVMGRGTSLKLNDEQRALLLDITARNLEQLAALIDSLRVFNDADQGILHVALEPVPVVSLFHDCAEDFPQERTNRVLRLECPEELEVRVDKMLFKQVITHLVANAMKFSPPGSTVTLEAIARNGDVVITVRDEGPGFPARDSERIFEKSVRLVRGARGLGLGLYVARAIVDAHNGHVEATSEVGRGASFEVSIPA